MEMVSISMSRSAVLPSSDILNIFNIGGGNEVVKPTQFYCAQSWIYPWLGFLREKNRGMSTE